MACVIYLSHPQVNIDKDVPVPNWSLSAAGLERARTASKLPWANRIDQILCSDETKAVETAQCFADSLELEYIIAENTGENDRSSTGFLPPEKFEEAANSFMNNPHESYRGWERAIDAQARIVAATSHALASLPPADLTLIIGHGGVGTLLKCHIAKRAIARSEDQLPNGGGNVFAFDLETKRLLCDWTAMEEFSGVEL